jgi:uncharacterized protein YkwD
VGVACALLTASALASPITLATSKNPARPGRATRQCTLGRTAPRPQCHAPNATPASIRRVAAKHASKIATRAPVADTAPCANTGLTPSAANIATVESATLCLVNQVRGEHGLPALDENSDLQHASDAHNNDMVTRDYFEHTDPSGGTPLSRIEATGYINASLSYIVGENIAWGTLSLSTPAAIVNAWVNSPDHLANILDTTYTQTGVSASPQAPASLASGQQGAIYTEDFGGIDKSA